MYNMVGPRMYENKTHETDDTDDRQTKGGCIYNSEEKFLYEHMFDLFYFLSSIIFLHTHTHTLTVSYLGRIGTDKKINK